MIKPRLAAFLLVLSAMGALALSGPAVSRARADDDVYTVIVKKQEEKQKTSWYLDDWFVAKDKMRIMDMWLALHSPSPYEFYVAPEYQLVNTSSGGTAERYASDSWRFKAAAYASIFGLGFEKNLNPDSEWTALFLLRVFGFNAQMTNLTFLAGVRSEGDPVDGRNAVVGGTYTLSMTHFFGLDGSYRHYFPTAGGASGVSSSGDRWELGPFIDFAALRVYVKYFSDSETQTSSSLLLPVDGKGFLVGAQLFF
jgi:hypothetical protein